MESDRLSGKKPPALLCRIMPVIGAALYLSLIFNNNLWMDEAFSAALLRGSMKDVLAASAADTLPPLYNILNKLMTMVFGYYPWAMKLTSVLPMILLLLLSAGPVRRRFGEWTSLLFSLCLCGMPCFFFYGVEIRMYSLGLFFATASGIFGLEYFLDRKKRDLVLFLLTSLGAGYTHHFAFVAVGFVYLFLLIAMFLKKRLKEWFLLLLLTGIGYLPCLLVTLQQMKRVGGYFSMPDITPGFVFSCIKLPFTTEFTPLSLLLILCFFAVCIAGMLQLLLQVRRKAPDASLAEGILGLLVFPGVLAFGCLATLLFTANIFSERYLVPSMGLMWLGFSVILPRLSFRKETLRNAALILAAVLLVLTDLRTYYGQFTREYAPGVDRMISDFDRMISPGDAYMIQEDNYQIEICFRYYFPEFQKTTPEKADAVTGKLWYLKVPGFESYEQTLIDAGYTPTYVGDYNFDRYSFSLYSLSRK